MDTIVICSGGLDSVTLAHKVAAERRLSGLLSFDYGQRHVKELDCAARCAAPRLERGNAQAAQLPCKRIWDWWRKAPAGSTA